MSTIALNLPGRRAVDPARPRTDAHDGRNRLAQPVVTPDKRQILADHRLMQAVADGDEAAFARLMRDEAPRLVRLARGMLADSPGEAEEVVQEALLRLWQAADGWQPNGRVSTWLHQVVYRLSIDAIRRRRPTVEIGEIESELEDGGDGADVLMVRSDDVRLVQAAIARLPERQRAAILLFHFQDLSQAEASAVMGIGENAYESLLARARRGLRAALADDVAEEERS
jgi:RNA polymerase sigma-70 factor (ECF subfamily)